MTDKDFMKEVKRCEEEVAASSKKLRTAFHHHIWHSMIQAYKRVGIPKKYWLLPVIIDNKFEFVAVED